MQRFELVDAVARIVERLGESLFLVELPNGHRVIARPSAASMLAVPLNPELSASAGQELVASENDSLIGREVLVRLRAFDMASAVITCLAPSGKGELDS